MNLKCNFKISYIEKETNWRGGGGGNAYIFLFKKLNGLDNS